MNSTNPDDICPTIKPILILLNDLMPGGERHHLMPGDERMRLLPFMERAMGTANAPKEVLVMRSNACAKFAQVCVAIADRSSAIRRDYGKPAYVSYAETVSDLDWHLGERSIEAIIIYSSAASEYAAKCAKAAEKDDGLAHFVANWNKEIVEAALQCLDEMCPKAAPAKDNEK